MGVEVITQHSPGSVVYVVCDPKVHNQDNQKNIFPHNETTQAKGVLLCLLLGFILLLLCTFKKEMESDNQSPRTSPEN